MVGTATSERIVGGLLPGYLLSRVAAGDNDVPGTRAEDYGLLPSEKVSRVATRSWAYLREEWRDLQTRLLHGGETHRGRVTREWLLILLRELGYTRLDAAPPGGITADDRQFPISHIWESHVPVHLLNWDADLDHRTVGARGPAAVAAPQSMVQQVLNRSDAYLWAILSNGTRLRLLRDSTTLVGSAYLEFDLESMFEGDQYSDFLRLYLCCHSSRLAIRDSEMGPASYWLEHWREYAGQQGVRALGQLRDGVLSALQWLGTGFTSHPANGSLRSALACDELSVRDFNRSLQRLVYRLLFWFVAEDRGVLLIPRPKDLAHWQNHELAIAWYSDYFSSDRLRRLARAHRHSRHGDLWQSVQVVFDALGAEGGEPALALPGLGGLFDNGALDRPLRGHRRDSALDEPVAGLQLSNTHLLSAVEALSVVRDGDVRRRVDFQHLGARELGSVYEQLLELHPRYDPATFTFTLERLAGHERKTTGSYYTPESLVECLLDSALQPLIDEAVASATPAASLLDLTVCDPACGSGHFLIAAARRIAKVLAAEETDELEPSHAAVQSALRRVVARCIYGVDVNPMAVELAKISLWLEALEPGKPLSFLNENIRVGNSLLGTTPKLLKDGIPDAAFIPLEGDDRKIVSALKKQNAFERPGQTLAPLPDITVTNTALAKQSAAILRTDPASLADVHVQEQRAAQLEEDRAQAKRQADAWCAAFVQLKTPETRATAITEAVLRQLGTAPLGTHPAEPAVRDLTRRYRFFHWHIEFPHIFEVPEDSEAADDRTGWTGGFSCVLSNPPWERVKLQEQEFFASRDIDIANAPNAAARKKLIKALPTSPDPAKQQLAQDFATAKREAEATSQFLRSSARYPLAGRGDVNTYAIFAELDWSVLRTSGRAGVVLPLGIATDATTQHYFKHIVTSDGLESLYGFREVRRVFLETDDRKPFCLLVLRRGPGGPARFVFGINSVQDLEKFDVVFQLTPAEINLLNPNTGTCPIFSGRRDAEITLNIYRRVPVLIKEGDPNGNPWGVSFMTMFHMSNDSDKFNNRHELENDGWSLNGNTFTKSDARMLPLYEAKMIHHYDHRWATYQPDGSIRNVTAKERADPDFVATPRYWVNSMDVSSALGELSGREWLLGFRDICRSTDERTVIANVFPRSAVGHTLPLIVVEESRIFCLLAFLDSFVVDYVARQKLGGTHLTYSYLQQLPMPSVRVLDQPVPWAPEQTMHNWIHTRSSTLATSSASVTNAECMVIRAELDAACFLLYGIERNNVAHIMDSFPIIKRREETAYGEYQTRRRILAAYDEMNNAEKMRRSN